MSVEVEKEEPYNYFHQQQVELIKQIRNYLVEHIEQKVTIEELVSLFCISGTTLKSCFRGVFGMPIGVYMKEYRMKQAGIILKENICSVAEVATRVGYESQSKFSSAFKEYHAMTPLEYRKAYKGL
jgi:AraC-like DNA-binding protein